MLIHIDTEPLQCDPQMTKTVVDVGLSWLPTLKRPPRASAASSGGCDASELVEKLDTSISLPFTRTCAMVNRRPMMRHRQRVLLNTDLTCGSRWNQDPASVRH